MMGRREVIVDGCWLKGSRHNSAPYLWHVNQAISESWSSASPFLKEGERCEIKQVRMFLMYWRSIGYFLGFWLLLATLSQSLWGSLVATCNKILHLLLNIPSSSYFRISLLQFISIEDTHIFYTSDPSVKLTVLAVNDCLWQHLEVTHVAYKKT